jgi:hypothetical protein
VTDDLSGLTLTEQGKFDPLRQQALVFATMVQHYHCYAILEDQSMLC